MKDRSIFLYAEPDEDTPREFIQQYAQCSTCYFWTNGGCLIHSRSIEVPAGATCNFYVMGAPSFEKKGEELPYVDTPESGLETRQVRCSNCRHFAKNKCMFYDLLNRNFPSMFNLNENVDPCGCCTANEEKKNG